MALPIYSNLVVKADPANLAQVQFELKKAFSNNFLTVDIAQKGGFDDFKKAIAATNQQAKGLVGTLQDVGIQVSTVTRRFSAYFIASGAILSSVVAFKSVIGEAIKFQDELIKIKQVSGDADSQVRKLGDTIGNLAKQYGVSSGELIKSATVLRQAGLNTKEVTLAIQALAKTDLAPNFDSIAKTTEGVIAIFQQFGRDAGKLEGQLGALNAVAGEFATEASDLITLVQKAGGAAKSSGANLEELVALFTSVRATTRESADAIATGLRTIFGRLQRPDTLKFLDDLGIKLRYTAQEAANLGNADLAGKFIGPFEAIQKIAAGTKGLGQGSTLFSNIVEQIGGLRQLSRVVPLLEETTTLIEAYNVALAGKTSLEAQALIKQDSYLNQLTKIKEEFLAIGRALVESEGFGRFAQTLQTAAQAAISLVNALAPILPYLGVIIGGNVLGGAIRGFGQGIFASSGIGNYNVPPPPRRHASGGIIPGPSDGDKYPALLEGGEAVIPAKSVRKYAAIIPGLISGKLPRFTEGFMPDFVGTSKDDEAKLKKILLEISKRSGVDLKDFATKIIRVVPEGGVPNAPNAPAGYSGKNETMLLTPKALDSDKLFRMVAHEMGHGLDKSLGRPSSSISPEMAKKLLDKDPQVLMAKNNPSNKQAYFDYLAQKNEIFARRFQQGISSKESLSGILSSMGISKELGVDKGSSIYDKMVADHFKAEKASQIAASIPKNPTPINSTAALAQAAVTYPMSSLTNQKQIMELEKEINQAKGGYSSARKGGDDVSAAAYRKRAIELIQQQKELSRLNPPLNPGYNPQVTPTVTPQMGMTSAMGTYGRVLQNIPPVSPMAGLVHNVGWSGYGSVSPNNPHIPPPPNTYLPTNHLYNINNAPYGLIGGAHLGGNPPNNPPPNGPNGPNNPPPNGPNPPNGPGGGTTKESVFKRLQQSNRFNQLSSLTGVALPLGLAVASQNSDDPENKRGFSNAAFGASIGATAGSLGGPIGTIAGSLIGAVAGYFLGVEEAAKDLKKKTLASKLDESIKGLNEAIENIAQGSGSISDLTVSLERTKRVSIETAISNTEGKSSSEVIKNINSEFKKNAGVLAPSLQSILQQEAKKQGKSGQTKTFDDTDEDIKKLISTLASLRGVTSGTIKKEIGKVFDASKADEDRKKADTRFNVEINKSIASATQFSDAVTRAAEEVKNLDEKLKVITGGGYRPASFDVGKFGSVDKFALNRLSGLGGGAFGQVTDEVKAVSDISKFLPEVLSRVVKPGEQTTDFLSGEFESQFKKIGEQTGKQFDTKVIRIMADKLGSLKSDELFENFKKDPEKFAKEFEHQFEPMLRAAQSIGKSLEERDKAYQDGLRHLLEINSKLNDLSERKNAITTEGLIARREFLSENAGINPSRISNSDIVFGQFNKEQDRLLGQSGIGENASAIAGLINSLKEEQKVLQKKAKVEANSIEGSTKFRDELYNTEKKLADANRALERLANTSERLAALQKDLAILQATREAKLGLTKSLITATPAELLQKQYDALAARLLIQNGGYNTRKYFDRIGASRGDPNLGANVTRQGYDTLENQYGDVELSSRFDEVIKDNKGKVIGRKKKTGKEISKLLQEEDNARAEGALNAQKEKEKILKVQQKALEVRKGAGADIVAGIIGAGAGANLGKLGAVDVMRINLEKTATSFSQVLKENNAAFFTKIDQYIAELQNNALSSQLAAEEVKKNELEPTAKAFDALPQGIDISKISDYAKNAKIVKEAQAEIDDSDNTIKDKSQQVAEIIASAGGKESSEAIAGRIANSGLGLNQQSQIKILDSLRFSKIDFAGLRKQLMKDGLSEDQANKEIAAVLQPAYESYIKDLQKADLVKKRDNALAKIPDAAKPILKLPDQYLDVYQNERNIQSKRKQFGLSNARIEEIKEEQRKREGFLGPIIPPELLIDRNSPVLEPGRIGVAPNPIPKNIPPVILGDEKVPQKPQTIDEIRKPFLDSLGPVPEGFRRTSEGDLVPEFKAILPKPSPPPQGINLPQFLGVGINAPVGIGANANVGDDLVGSFERANKIFTDFTTNFGKQIEALANIPRVIDMNINQRVEVIINGAQVLANLEPSMKKIAEGAVSRAIEVIGGQLRENNISIKYNPSAQVSNAREQSVGNNPLYEGGEGL